MSEPTSHESNNHPMAQNVFVLVMDQRRARLLRVLGRGNGGCRLETFRLSQSLGVKRWLSEGSTADGDPQVDPTEADPQQIRAMLRDDAVEFVQEVVSDLTALARSGQLDELFIVAAPQIMPLLKRELPLSLVERLMFTHEMSIAHMTEDDLLAKVLTLVDERS
jgi:protein required for attachment to host cells